MQVLPPGTRSDARWLIATRATRAFVDGFMSVLLPWYFTQLGFDSFVIGVIITVTLLGAGAATLAAGLTAHRIAPQRLLGAAAMLMIVAGIGCASFTTLWPILVVAGLGVLNPTAGDASVFAPLEQTVLARSAADRHRTALFARYALAGALFGAFGAQAAALPQWLAALFGIAPLDAVRGMFIAYAAAGLAHLAMYRRLEPEARHARDTPTVPLGPSRRRVYSLAALFSVDAFAGGFIGQSLLALWLFTRFDLSPAATGAIFFWSGIAAAVSQLAAAPLARRIGLVNTMVYTHLPSSVLLVLVPFMPNVGSAVALLVVRSLLSQMDVPARSSYVMAVVTPAERPAAASLTAVPRSLASALSPALAGYLLAVSAFGWPLVVCGVLKITYDVLLLAMFRNVRPPEEQR
jgi:MFS family permease